MLRQPLLAAALLAALAGVSCKPASAPQAAPSRPTTEPDFDAGIEVAYLTQGVQDLDGAVPLLAGRPGLLRIFLRAAAPGVAAPPARATLVDTASGTALRTWTATSPLAFLPTGLFEGVRGASWNVAVPGAEVQQGRHLVLEMDPVPGIPPELQQTTLRLPPEGSLDVRAGAPLAVTLVPVIQSGLTPDVTGSRSAASWLELAALLYPVVGADVEVAAPFTSFTALGAAGSGWSELLADLERKRVAEGSARHYLGVVRLASAAGTVGRGLVGGRSALAADLAEHYQRIAAHELGHNLGLRHAPCGTDDEGALDPDWPVDRDYAGAHTGVFGWDPRSGAIRDPAVTFDVMSYCGGEDTTWISDHGFLKALAAAPLAAAPRREPAAALAAPGARQPCLLVSGRLEGGRAWLDPAHAVDTVPSLLPAGDHRIELLDRDGRPLGSLAFAPWEAPSEEDGAPSSSHFAMAIPLSAPALAALDGLALWRGGQLLARRRAAAPGADPAPRLRAAAGGLVEVTWDAAARPEVMLVDPRTGEVAAFLRGGAATLPPGQLELRFSDGLRSDPPRRPAPEAE